MATASVTLATKSLVKLISRRLLPNFCTKSLAEYVQYSFIEKLTNRNLKNRPTEIL